MDQRIRILIVDDHPIFRRGLRQVIERDPAFELVGEAEDGESVLELARRTGAQVVVLDISLPRINGLEAARQLREKRSAARVIILTMHKEEDLFNKAMNLDVRGYVLKDNAVEDIVHCLRAVAAGDYYLSPSLSSYLLHRRRRTDQLEEIQPGLQSLTTAERRILKLIAANRTSKEIAGELGVSPRTVDAHRANICSKLNLRGSHCLLQFGIEHRAEM